MCHFFSGGGGTFPEEKLCETHHGAGGAGRGILASKCVDSRADVSSLYMQTGGKNFRMHHEVTLTGYKKVLNALGKCDSLVGHAFHVDCV
jgi:hypothetical protein